MPSREEEYELVPISPLRRLEKRLEKLESFSLEDPKNIFRDMMDIIRMNQQIVDELAKSNDALRIEISKLPAKLEELITDLKEIISFIKSSGEGEIVGIPSETMKPVVDKLDELVKENKSLSEKNDSILEVLDEISKRLKRPPIPVTKPLLRRPISPLPPGSLRR